MTTPPNTNLRLVSALLISGLVHVLMVWLTPISWEPLKKPKEVVRTIRLIPMQPLPKRAKQPPKRLAKRKQPPKKRQIRRRVRRKRRLIKRKRRISRKKRTKRRRRLAMAVPRPLPKRATPTPPRARPDAPPPKRRAEPVPKRRSYKHLDLRPQRLPTLARRPNRRAGKGKAGKTGKTPGKGKKLVPWAGKSRFARNMRAYHRAFISDLNDRRGLVDTFFGTATVVMDRCIETWIQRNLAKHLSTKQKIGWFTWGQGMPRRKPQWNGTFTVKISASGKRTVKLIKSRGVRKLDRLLYKTANRCMKRLNLPKRLKGKRIFIKFRTKALAFYRIEPKNLLGLTEVRNAQTGGMTIKFSHFGSLSVSSNTLILQQSVY